MNPVRGSSKSVKGRGNEVQILGTTQSQHDDQVIVIHQNSYYYITDYEYCDRIGIVLIVMCHEYMYIVYIHLILII